MAVLTVPEYNERVLFVGANGSGKTTLAREMLSRVPRYVVLDSKGDFPTVADDVIVRDVRDPRIRTGKESRIIVRPFGQSTSGRALDYVIYTCYLRGHERGKQEPFVLYVDEGLYLAKTGATQWLGAIAVAGRSINIGLWVSSQRTKWIPVEVRSEAWRWYVFYLGYRSDEMEVVEASKGSLSLQALEADTEYFSFIELRRDRHRAGRMTAIRFDPIRVVETPREGQRA